MALKMMDRFNESASRSVFPDRTVVMALDPIEGNKLSPKYDGPFTVIRQDRNGAYVLKDATGTELHRKYAASQLKVVLAEPEDLNAYIVKKVLDHKEPTKTYQEWRYLVRWKEYGPEHDSWEPFRYFFEINCIRDYWNNTGNFDPHSTRPSAPVAPTNIERANSNSNKRGFCTRSNSNEYQSTSTRSSKRLKSS
ncbi:hypothetical protein BGX27_004181 [Mortierella sp. AM989]|nr:hypothetical protein BGX27_004181 [Mortierella sp. AM989]